MNPMNRQWFFRGFRKQLRAALSPEKAASVWEAAGREYSAILAADPALKSHKGALALPVIALWRALSSTGEDAEALLNAYGDRLGGKFAKIVHALTCIPGVSRLL